MRKRSSRPPGRPKGPPKARKPPGKPGRPLEFTPQIGKAIVRIVREHGFETVAAECVGFDRITVAAWRDRGKNGDPIFADFYLDLMQAKAEYIRKDLSAIRSNKDWRARAFLLERVEASMRIASKHEHSAPGGAPIQHVVFAYPVPMPLGADPASVVLPTGHVMDPSKAPPTEPKDPAK
jgi:hypothetical protein